MVKLTPPLGWNSWNTFAQNINETVVRETADAMVETGLKDAGYEYVVIDDCWQAKERDAEGNLTYDKEKFPNGMKALADYVHSKGLKFGMYSCAGHLTCASMPGSFDHEFQDAATFASWDVDFLKYDFCYFPVHIHELGCDYYRRMGTALANSGREILFSICNWGIIDVKDWAKSCSASMWRSTLDIVDSWESIKSIALQQPALQPYNGQKCFNDMDMLVVGMNGKGNVGLTGCSYEEYRTHFCYWAMMGSPLMIGCDIRDMTEETKSILLNREIIAINQDMASCQPYMLNRQEDESVWVKQLANGDFAIGFFNFLDHDTGRYVSLFDMGLGGVTRKGLELTDLFTGERITVREMHSMKVAAHDCHMYRARVIDI